MHKLKNITVFLFGIVLGVGLSQLFNVLSWPLSYDVLSLRRNLRARNEGYYESSGGATGLNYEITFNRPKQKEYKQSGSLATRLYNETRVLCWILTGPTNHKKKAIYIKKTWGKRCNKLLFMSSADDEELGTIKLPVQEGRKNLWFKTREAFKYIWEHHRDDADWFLKADDDTYVIVENLRAFLYPFSSDSPVYFGCKFKPHVRQGYMSGGAGYVLSREALRRFADISYHNSTICRQGYFGSEDIEMGNCLQNVGVVAGDSRDEQKRGRFFPSGPQSHIIPKDKSHWYWRYIFYPTTDGLNCCSDHAVSFHYISPHTLYLMDYLIYKLRPFGVHYEEDVLPEKIDMAKILNQWKNDSSDNNLH